MRPSRAAVLILILLAAGACTRNPAATSDAQPHLQPDYLATHRPSLDGLIWGPQGGYVYYSPLHRQQGYPAAPRVAYAPPAGPAEAPRQHYAATPDPAPAPTAANSAMGGVYHPVAGPTEAPYTLDSGDRVRVVVHGQGGLNGSFVVDPSGMISLPLGGAVQARGFTKDQLAYAITEKLRQGYIREPKVAVDIEGYRPFFIFGEIVAPGQYPYVANLTTEAAVAIAGGYTPRADRRGVTVTRSANGQVYKGALPPNSVLRPGDTIEIAERWF